MHSRLRKIWVVDEVDVLAEQCDLSDVGMDGLVEESNMSKGG
jgi:hypothetical protein